MIDRMKNPEELEIDIVNTSFEMKMGMVPIIDVLEKNTKTIFRKISITKNSETGEIQVNFPKELFKYVIINLPFLTDLKKAIAKKIQENEFMMRYIDEHNASVSKFMKENPPPTEEEMLEWVWINGDE